MTRGRLHVRVPAPELTEYAVEIRAGGLAELPAVLAGIPAAAVAVIVPDDIAELYGAGVVAALRSAGRRTELFAYAAGEAHKTRATWGALTDRMHEAQFGRDTCVVALGGGVTGDLAGFVAATYMRGVPCVQVPTTLLAMIDAAVGGKTGVDTPAGKNLVGAFHAPSFVLIDPHVLRTLPAQELRAGMAEAIKHGAIADAAYFDWIAQQANALLSLEPDAVAVLIRRSIEIKAGIVAEDPYERGRRAILNFGHTVGHALELHSDFGLPHGFAVAAGMVAEAGIGEQLGVTEAGTRERLAEALQAFGLPSSLDRPLRDLMTAIRLDKKARGAQARAVLLERIGAAAPATDGSWTHVVENVVLEQASPGVRDV